MPKKYLISGGAGFIGSNLAKRLQLVEPDAEIIAIDNFSSGSFLNLAAFKGEIVNAGAADTFHNLDKIDTVFHLASNTNTNDTDIKSQWQNVTVFEDILRKYAKSKIVYASSAAVYGAMPGNKTHFTETDALRPLNAYGFSKVEMEKRAVKHPNCIGLRFFNVFGEGEQYKGRNASMIYQMAKEVLKGNLIHLIPDGSQFRDFVPINSVVDALILAEKNLNNRLIKTSPKVFNVGSGQSVSFNKIASIIQDEVRNVPISYDIKRPDFFQDATCANLGLIREEMGYEPPKNVLEDIRNYIKLIKSI